MPVPLKHMNNANILRAEFIIFIPNYPPPPMSYTGQIKPRLSFFKNRSENGMLSSTLLSYSLLWVKWSNLPRSPQIFLRLFTKNTHILLTPSNHPKISQHSYTSYHTWRKQGVLACSHGDHYYLELWRKIIYQSEKKVENISKCSISRIFILISPIQQI